MANSEITACTRSPPGYLWFVQFCRGVSVAVAQLQARTASYDYVVAHKLITPEYGYALGASFSVPIMETACRPHVVQNFAKFCLHSQGVKYVNMLAKWSPVSSIHFLRIHCPTWLLRIKSSHSVRRFIPPVLLLNAVGR